MSVFRQGYDPGASAVIAKVGVRAVESIERHCKRVVLVIRSHGNCVGTCTGRQRYYGSQRVYLFTPQDSLKG
jgi:hypothetical protein